MTSSTSPEPCTLTLLLSRGRHPASRRRRQANSASRRKLIEGRSLETWLRQFSSELPFLSGGPIQLSFLPDLTAYGGKLLSGQTDRGRAVYAASFLSERRIVLERSLAGSAADLRLILTHELFHFVWWRLGSNRRREYDQLLLAERLRSARGELGESSAVAKEAVGPLDEPVPLKRWKNYVCESFCDTGAWYFAGVTEHKYFQLAPRWKAKRAAFLASIPTMRV